MNFVNHLWEEIERMNRMENREYVRKLLSQSPLKRVPFGLTRQAAEAESSESKWRERCADALITLASDDDDESKWEQLLLPQSLAPLADIECGELVETIVEATLLALPEGSSFMDKVAAQVKKTPGCPVFLPGCVVGTFHACLCRDELLQSWIDFSVLFVFLEAIINEPGLKKSVKLEGAKASEFAKLLAKTADRMWDAPVEKKFAWLRKAQWEEQGSATDGELCETMLLNFHDQLVSGFVHKFVARSPVRKQAQMLLDFVEAEEKRTAVCI